MSKRDKLIKYANDEVKNNSLYLWGGQGENVMTTTPETIRKKETNDQNAARVLKCLAGKINNGANMKKAKFFDCSGLVVDILRRLGIISDTADYTAQGIYNDLCVPVLKADIRPSDLCFISSSGKISHVGIITDTNICVEAVGRDVGIISRGMNKNSWNLYGRVKGL